jgi:hypothetical protein
MRTFRIDRSDPALLHDQVAAEIRRGVRCDYCARAACLNSVAATESPSRVLPLSGARLSSALKSSCKWPAWRDIVAMSCSS